MADPPPELRINLGALNGAAVGAAAAAAAVGGGAGAAVGAAAGAGAGAGAAGASFVPISLICAGLGAFRAMTVGREGVFTCSYCLAGSAVFAMISFIL